eukprot:7290076-Heterocapsa_arctica.AAC.1
MLRNIDFLYTATVENNKQRFLLAVLTSETGDDRREVVQVHAIRCTSGHSIPVDTTKLSTPLLANMAHDISAISHVTKSIYLANIFRSGLCPGGVDP